MWQASWSRPSEISRWGDPAEALRWLWVNGKFQAGLPHGGAGLLSSTWSETTWQRLQSIGGETSIRRPEPCVVHGRWQLWKPCAPLNYNVFRFACLSARSLTC